MWTMDAHFTARVVIGFGLTALGVAVLGMGTGGKAFAQNYPYAPPGAYRGAPVAPIDDDDLVPLPAPGPYGRPSGATAPYPYDVRPPGAVQREALPAPGGAVPAPYGGTYADAPPPGRGYRYGPWEAVRPPADVYSPDGALPPGPGGRPYDYGTRDYGARSPIETAPGPGVGPSPGYATLPPDYQPERGQPKELPPQFRRQMVDYASREPAGTIIIDTPNTYLYLVLGGGKAMRYGIGVGREGFTWAGREKVSRMSEWPDWHPPKEMIDRQPYLPRFMAGGESNPLGARALYLGNTLYRIHGTNQPSTIGSFVSSGCIRLTNADIEDLYGRVTVGTKVVVLPGKQSPETTASVR
jgi:lipoprotein-anchoring transpeptidase ErfK/SrfK